MDHITEEQWKDHAKITARLKDGEVVFDVESYTSHE